MNFWSASFWAPGFWAPSTWAEDAAPSLASAALAAFTLTGDALPPLQVEHPPYVVTVEQPNLPLRRLGLTLNLRKEPPIIFAAQVRSLTLTPPTRPPLTLRPSPRVWVFDGTNSDYQFFGEFDESAWP